MHRAQWDK